MDSSSPFTVMTNIFVTEFSVSVKHLVKSPIGSLHSFRELAT